LTKANESQPFWTR